jgi:hypothetical protein
MVNKIGYDMDVIDKITKALQEEEGFEHSIRIRTNQKTYDFTSKLNPRWFKIYDTLLDDLDFNFECIDDYFKLPKYNTIPKYILPECNYTTINIFISCDFNLASKNQFNFWDIKFNNMYCTTIISLYDTNFDNLYHIINDDNPI